LQVAEQCIAIAEDASQTHGQDCELRAAFVAYRDIGEAKNVQSLDFTTSLEEFEAYVRGVTAEGGDDFCEDVFGGLERLGSCPGARRRGALSACSTWGTRPATGRRTTI